jgi:hypothetical protein
MTTEEFTELGVVVGNIPLAILDSENVVINILSISASETEESRQQFCEMSGGTSYQEVTGPGLKIGATWDGELFTNPVEPATIPEEVVTASEAVIERPSEEPPLPN